VPTIFLHFDAKIFRHFAFILYFTRRATVSSPSLMPHRLFLRYYYIILFSLISSMPQFSRDDAALLILLPRDAGRELCRQPARRHA